MKGSITTSWWICTCLFVAFLIDVSEVTAQPVQDPVAVAAAGDFVAAGYEFEREAWLASDNTEHGVALISRINCYFMEGKYEEAYRTSGRFRYEGLHDTLVVKCRHTAALSAYMSGKYSESISEIRQLCFHVPDPKLTGQSMFLLALSYNELRDWHAADSVLKKTIIDSQTPQDIKDSLFFVISSQYAPGNFPALKSRKKAETWSTFIPGAGHMYAGYVGEGLVNFTLQAASLGFIGYHIYIAHYLTAFTIGSGLFQHFYFGGINRAGFLAEKRNYVNLRKFNDPRKEMIMEMQLMLYP